VVPDPINQFLQAEERATATLMGFFADARDELEGFIRTGDLSPSDQVFYRQLLDETNRIASSVEGKATAWASDVIPEAMSAGWRTNSPIVVNQGALEALSRSTLSLIRQTTDGIRQSIRQSIAKSILHGWSGAQTRESILASGLTNIPHWPSVEYRAGVIARTETMRAYNTGAVDGVVANGARFVRWIVSPDEAVCPICLPRDNVVFRVGGGQPLAHRTPMNDTNLVAAVNRLRAEVAEADERRVVFDTYLQNSLSMLSRQWIGKMGDAQMLDLSGVIAAESRFKGTIDGAKDWLRRNADRIQLADAAGTTLGNDDVPGNPYPGAQPLPQIPAHPRCRCTTRAEYRDKDGKVIRSTATEQVPQLPKDAMGGDMPGRLPPSAGEIEDQAEVRWAKTRLAKDDISNQMLGLLGGRTIDYDAALLRGACPLGGDLAGFENRLKTLESYIRKVKDILKNEPGLTAAEGVNGVHDLLRFTSRYNPDEFADRTLETVGRLKRDGWTRTKWKPTWEAGSYQGVNSNWTRGGVEMEMQFHTPATFANKERAHELYRTLEGMSADDPRYQDMVDEMASIFNQAKPPGWDRVVAG
jgi:hypothetical protein